MKIRSVSREDLLEIVRIHEIAFVDFFLTKLGSGFLRTYYKAIICDGNSIKLCAVDGSDKIVGFAVGSIKSKNFYKKLILKNLFIFSIQGVIIFFTNVLDIVRLFRNVEKRTEVFDDGEYAELLSIAVDSDSKGSGVGKALLKEFEIVIKKQGCKKIALTTDYENNKYTIDFYEKSGYAVYYDFVAYPGRRMYKLIKNI